MREFWAELRHKSGNLKALLGPYETREAAESAGRAAWSRAFTVGYGNGAAYFDTRQVRPS
jgi:hypothetical protein